MLKKTTVAAAALLLGLSAPAAQADEALVTFKMLNLETAQELANATLNECRKQGFQVAVAVVDRFGNLQVSLRDRFAGPHTSETARRKAWTSVSFRTDTMALSDLTQAGKAQSGVRFIEDALMAGGGVQVEAGGSIVAGVGVSGAPGGQLDHDCALVGIEAIGDKLF